MRLGLRVEQRVTVKHHVRALQQLLDTAVGDLQDAMEAIQTERHTKKQLAAQLVDLQDRASERGVMQAVERETELTASLEQVLFSEKGRLGYEGLGSGRGDHQSGVDDRKGKGQGREGLGLRLLTALYVCVGALVLTLQCRHTICAFQNLDWLSCVAVMLHGSSSCCYVFALEFTDVASCVSRLA